MHPLIEEILQDIQEKFHLQHFDFLHHSIFKEKNIHNQPTYTVTLEWQAIDENNQQEIIFFDVDLYTKKITALSLPETITLDSLPSAEEEETIINWIEAETGLTFGKQFKLIEHNEQYIHFQAAIDNIPVYPSGEIIIEFNKNGQFRTFSIAGIFPQLDKIDLEPFSLNKTQIEPIIKEELVKIKLPLNEDKKWLICYMLPEFFISNDGSKYIFQEKLRTENSFVPIFQILEWSNRKQIKLSSEPLQLSTETTVETALQDENLEKTITNEEITKLTEATTNYLATLYENDSGKWELESFHVEGRYIIATLDSKGSMKQIPQRRLTIFFDEQTQEPINHEENDKLMQLYKDFTVANEININREEAFQLLNDQIEIEPIYLYDKQANRYKVCGRIHSDYVVLADTGEIISLRG